MTDLAEKGAAATGHHLTTQAALEVIDMGGNAFDGAIAAAFMACVCEPVLASPGGGGFAMVRKGGSTQLVDFFAQTPRSQTQSTPDFQEVIADFGTARQVFHIGHASSATPGFVAGIFSLHEKFGHLPMAKLITPARDAARAGVAVTSFQHYLSSVVSQILLHSRQSRKLFAPDGQLHAEGELFQNLELAAFLDELGRTGEKAFPVGAVLQAQQSNGHLRVADFDNYQVIERQGQQVDVNGSQIHLNPYPAAGGFLIGLALKNLQGNTVVDVAQALKSVDIARQNAGNDLAELLAAAGPPAHRGTTQICVVDAAQNACSMTLSNGEGNGHIVGDCGFMLNNMLGEADINPGGMLGWAQDSRMSSMMCPTIVEHRDGSVLALGSGGSNRIRSAIFHVLVNLLIKEQDIDLAVEAARLHVENGHLDFEPFDNEDLTAQLESAFPDHRQWPEKNMFFGGCHVAEIGQSGQFSGRGDTRRYGHFASL